MITLTGKKVSEGIVMGRLVFYNRGEKEIRRFSVEDVNKETGRFQKARERAIAELQELCSDSEKGVGETNAMIFEIQQMLLEDGDFIDSITSIIKEERMNAEYAVKTGAEKFIENFGRIQDMCVDMKRMCGMLRIEFCRFCRECAEERCSLMSRLLWRQRICIQAKPLCLIKQRRLVL